METVLITGATGSIGSNLAARLAEKGTRIRILRRTESDLRALEGVSVEHAFGDVRDPDSLRRAVRGCTVVYHAAALVTHATRRRQEQYEVNVLGTRNVAEACIREGVRRLVHVSSIAAIGYPREGELATEETPFNWTGREGYKTSKHRSEIEIAAAVERGLDAVIVNPAVVIGERDVNFRGGQLVRDARRGLLFFYVEGGMNVVYVGDVVNGMIQAAARGRTGERYILGGENLTHREIFERTAILVGGRKPLGRLPVPLLKAAAFVIETASSPLGIEPLITSDLVDNAGRFNWFSSDKAVRELGYTITPFDATIFRALEWYRAHHLL